MRKRKEAKEAIFNEKQKYLDDIQALLGGIKEAAEPLKNHFHLPPRDAVHQQHYQAAASLLPLPLYIVYRQLKAVAAIYGDPVEVQVTGTLLHLLMSNFCKKVTYTCKQLSWLWLKLFGSLSTTHCSSVTSLRLQL